MARPQAPSAFAPGWAIVIALVLIGGIYATSFFLSPDDDQVLCLLRALTGVPCPLCGMSRAFIRISHADLAGAVSLHVLSPAVYLGGILMAVALAGELAGSRRLSLRVLGSPPTLLAIGVGVFAVFWAIRLLALWHSGVLGEAFRSSHLGRVLFRS